MNQEPATPARPNRLVQVVRIFFASPWRPASTSQSTLDLSLWSAFFVQIVSALAGVAAVVLVAAVGEAGSPFDFSEVLKEASKSVGYFLVLLAENPNTTVLIVLGIALLYQAVLLGLAVTVMPWGACDEPLSRSFRHALSRMWLQTPHLVWGILLVGAVAIGLETSKQSWNALHPYDLPETPPMPQGLKYGTPAWDQYNRAAQVHWDEVHRIEVEVRRKRPWYLRYDDAIITHAVLLNIIWFLAALLRAVGVPRRTPAMLRPPRCDACGYDLTTMPLESRCPECGEPVAASLGPAARPGAPWQQAGLPLLQRWWKTWTAAIFRPQAFGRGLRLTTPDADHRWFVLLHLPLVFLIAALSLPAVYYAIEGKSPFPDDAELVFIGSPVFGTVCMLGALGLCLSTAGRFGFWYQWREKRNLLTGAIQVTSYLIVYLLAWELFGAVTGILAMAAARHDWLNQFAFARRVGEEPLAFLLWSALNLPWAFVYWTRARHAIAAMRYANR